MDWFSRWFLKAALIWLALGVLIGLAMALRPAWIAYRALHAHLTLLGFVAMTIFGVAYHVIPRFAGNPLHSPRLAALHWWLANLGLAVLLAGFAFPPGLSPAGRALVAAGGLTTAASAWLFAYNIWRTLDGGRQAHPGTPRPLTVVQPPGRRQ